MEKLVFVLFFLKICTFWYLLSKKVSKYYHLSLTNHKLSL